MSGTSVAAVDVGASSGRVMIGRVSRDELRLEPVSRFRTGSVALRDGTSPTGGLYVDAVGVHRQILDGLREASGRAELASVGIDTWAVDYGLLRSGRLLGIPRHYRDPRTDAAAAAVHERIPFDELAAQNGLQFLPFNTLYQLEADRADGLLSLADRMLLLPDLLAFWLTGEQVAERTNASTTGLLTPEGNGWNTGLLQRLGLPERILAPLVSPGTRIGPIAGAAADDGGPAGLPVTAIGSHDTASAVAAVPMTTPDAAYISCGTWGLVGVELERPVLSAAAREANFTNEGGVDARVRFLHNVTGLWLLSESVRTWEADGFPADLPSLLEAAASVDEPQPVIDTDDPMFLAPGDMPARIASWLRDHDRPVPRSRAALVRCILESLAEAFARSVRTASRLSGRDVTVIHMVGGGSQNALLCRLTAQRSGMPVIAGPVEATALGNVLVQARAEGAVTGSVDALRDLVARTTRPVRYDP